MTNLTELEALLAEAGLNENQFIKRVEHIPYSLKKIYSAITGEDILIARELLVDNRVFIGIEYAPDGKPVSTYTTDKTGKRITLDHAENRQTKEAHAPKDLISERLNEVAKNISRQPIANEPQTQPKVKKAVRTNTAPNLTTLKELQNSKRQNG